MSCALQVVVCQLAKKEKKAKVAEREALVRAASGVLNTLPGLNLDLICANLENDPIILPGGNTKNTRFSPFW